MTPEIARAFNDWQKQHPLTGFQGATASWAQAAFAAGVEYGAEKEMKAYIRARVEVRMQRLMDTREAMSEGRRKDHDG